MQRKHTKKRIKVSSAKDKGRRLQQWVCQKVSEVTGFEYGKDKPIESRPMGQGGVDVRLEKQVQELFPYAVECKAQEKWSVHEWIEQAKENSYKMEGYNRWLLVCKRSRKEPIVIMDAETFFDFLCTSEIRLEQLMDKIHEKLK